MEGVPVGDEQAQAGGGVPMVAGMPLNIMVMKEPRGMIRAIAVVSLLSIPTVLEHNYALCRDGLLS